MSENLECVKQIGRGGHSEVWLVRIDDAMNEHAWKVPFNQHRLADELEKLNRIGQQRNIVSCLGIAEIGGRQGLLMEYIPGMDLSGYLPEMVDQYLCGTLSHTDFWSAIQYIIKEITDGHCFPGRKRLRPPGHQTGKHKNPSGQAIADHCRFW